MMMAMIDSRGSRDSPASAPADCLRERTVGPSTVVELRGEVDLLTVPAVTERLDELTSAGRPRLVLDLRPVTFIDCTGLGALCRARRRTLGRGGRLGLVTDNPRFLRILRLTGLARAFELYGAPSDALAAMGPAGPLPEAPPPPAPPRPVTPG